MTRTLPPPFGAATVDRTVPGTEAGGRRVDVTADSRVGAVVRTGTLVGRYVVRRTVGRGGMGIVYEAFDPNLERSVALKLIGTEAAAHDRERLLHEARAMAQVSHPNVITVVDVVEFGSQVCIAMELIRGMTLKAWLRATPRTTPEIVERFVEAGRGLSALHDAGLVHRDFKPDNVMVEGNRTVVMDLGLAADGDQQADGTLRFAGTPAYMSPEQFSGDRLDARSDQFAFAISLYEALFGFRPFRGETPAALAGAVELGQLRPPPRGHGVSRSMRAALAKALNRDPKLRFESISSMLAALGPVYRGWWFGIVATASLLGLGVYAASTSREENSDCSDPAAALEDVWNDGARSDLVRAFEAVEAEYVRARGKAVIDGVDRFAAAWTTSYARACDAVAAESTGADREMFCLRKNRARLTGLVAALSGAKGEALDAAARSASRLDAMEDCSLASSAVPEIRDRELILRFAEIGALIDAGQWSVASVALEEALAGGAGASHVVAWRAADLRGQVAVAEGRYVDAADWFRDAYYGARAAGFDIEGTTIAARTTRVFANRLREPRNAGRWRREVEAGLASSEPAPELQVSALIAVGAAWTESGDLDRATSTLRAAVSIADEHLPTSDVRRAQATNHLGGSLYAGERYEEALEAYVRAAELYAAAEGTGHPDRAFAIGNTANVLMELGRIDESEAVHQEAIALATAAYGGRHPTVGLLRTNFAEARFENGAFADAYAEATEALEILEARLGLDHPTTVFARDLAAKAQSAMPRGAKP